MIGKRKNHTTRTLFRDSKNKVRKIFPEDEKVENMNEIMRCQGHGKEDQGAQQQLSDEMWE